MNSDTIKHIQGLTNVDFERDSAETESEHSSLSSQLIQFLENEARSCSMDFGCITPEYVYRMWGGSVAIDEIATGLTEIRKQGFTE